MNNVHFAIPEIYGETLSYYELLRKLVDKTNYLIENYNTVPEQIAEEVKNLDASQLFSEVLNQLIHSIATDNTKSANAVKVYKKHDLLYATFNETVNLYESLIDFSTGTATELIPGTNIREVNISELFIELRKLIDINKNNIEAVTAVANGNSAEITTIHSDITAIENKNTEQDNEITTIHSDITSIENKNTEQDNEITTIHSDITSIENKNTEQDNELSTLRTMLSSPYNFKGDVASISALPASGEVNDTYYVQDLKYKVTWTGSAWVQSSLNEADYQTELSELKGDLDGTVLGFVQTKNVKPLWRNYTVFNDTGDPYPSNVIISTTEYISDEVIAVKPKTGYQCRIYIYDENGEYIGFLLADRSISKAESGTEYLHEFFDFSWYKFAHPTHKYRVSMKNSDLSTITVADYDNVIFYIADYDSFKNSALYKETDIFLSIGGISGAIGEDTLTDDRFRSGFLNGNEIIDIYSGGKFYVYGYRANGQYIGMWNGSNFITSNFDSSCLFKHIDLSSVIGADKYRICGYPYTNNNAVITLADTSALYARVRIKDIINKNEQNISFSKLKIAVWNIGHFSDGANPNTSITATDYQEKLTAFRALLNSVGADVLMIPEYSATFANVSGSEISAKNALFANYLNSFIGSQIRYSCNAMYSNIDIKGLSDVDYVCNQTAVITHTTDIEAKDYRYMHGTFVLNGKTVHIFGTHCAFDLNNADVETDQYAELLSLTNEYDHVIIIGDMNAVHNSKEFDIFVNAGFTIANHGYMGDIESYTGEQNIPNRALDNIMVKGLAMTRIQEVETALSDHNVLTCELSLY